MEEDKKFWTPDAKYGFAFIGALIVLLLLLNTAKGDRIETGHCICPEYGVCNMTTYSELMSHHNKNDSLRNTTYQYAWNDYVVKQKLATKECMNDETVVEVVSECVHNKWEKLAQEYV